MKGDFKRKFSPLTARGSSLRGPAPREYGNQTKLTVRVGFMIRSSERPQRWERRQANLGSKMPTMVLSETYSLRFCRVLRGGLACGGDWRHGGRCLNSKLRLTLNPRASRGGGSRPGESGTRNRADLVRLGCLFSSQSLCVETFSSLPQGENQSRDLTGDGETRQMLVHALAETAIIGLAERAGALAGGQGCPFKDVFELGVMGGIKPSHPHAFGGNHQFTLLQPILRAAASEQAHAPITPQFTLVAEAVGRLQQSQQQRHAYRSQAGNGAQNLLRRVLAAFRQQRAPCLGTKLQQQIQFLVEQ